ncbi:MAG: hypothetical protein VYC39_19280 [Myxococcota bacterium]|nr:hypothetical protein [Myxococcota bacterium]
MLARFEAKQLGALVIVLTFSVACTAEQCLLSDDIYSVQSRKTLRSDFLSYLGTPDEIDVNIFTSALEDYLSASYSFCKASEARSKACVRNNLNQVENIITNTQRHSPRERLEELLSLPSPASCSRPSEGDLSLEFTFWKQLSRQKTISASSSLKKLKSHREALYSLSTSSAAATKKTEDSESRARAAYNRGTLHYLLGNDLEALNLLTESATLSPQRSDTNYMSGAASLESGNYKRALSYAQAKSGTSENKSDRITSTQVKRVLLESAALRGLGRHKVADDLLGQFIEDTIKTLGAEHPIVARLYYEQAWMRANRRGFGPGQRLLRKSIKISKKHYPEVHPFVLDTQIAMAFMEVESGLPDDALRTLKVASKINEQLGSPQLPSLEIEFIRALAYADLDKFLDRAINIAGKTLYELRRSKLSAPYLEARIERWLEAI